MKKIIIPIAFIALTVVSCKKNYTCVCTDATGGEVKTFTNITSKQAHSNCTTVTTTDLGGTSKETCKLQ
jgi:hypothetical protein